MTAIAAMIGRVGLVAMLVGLTAQAALAQGLILKKRLSATLP